MTKPKRVITIESKGVRGVHQLPANVTPGPGVGVNAYRGTLIGNNGFSRSTTSVMADFNDAMLGVGKGAGNGQRIYGLKTLLRIADKLGEEKLLEAIATLSEEVLLDRNASLLLRTNAIDRVVELYARVAEMRKEKAEKNGDGEVVIGSAKEEGAAQAGLPAFNADAVRAAMEERGKGGVNPFTNEEKMAVALLTLAHANPREESEFVISAAEDALYKIDSPVLDRIMTSFQVAEKGGLISPYIDTGAKTA